MTRIYAHRGASAIHPENTLRAFRQALAIGVDGIEFDVHATADGIPVIIHDRDVGRTTDGAGYVDDIPLARVQTFDAGDGERVPTLAEVLALVGDAALLDVEIKAIGIERVVLDVLAQHPTVTWAISSFAWDTLRTVRWTVNDPREARRVADLGAFALCTDDPQHISRSRGII